MKNISTVNLLKEDLLQFSSLTPLHQLACGTGTDMDISCTHVVAVVKSRKATQVNFTGSAITFVKKASP